MRTGALNGMGSQKVVSSAELMRIAGSQDKKPRIYQWHSTSIVIKKILTLDEYMDCIRNIGQYCELEDGSIAYELLDFSIRVNIISSYACVELPDNIDDLYYLIYSSDLYESVCGWINRGQLESILNTAKSIYMS